MLTYFLFETWIGDKLLALFERITGLTIQPME
jgi:hypothetical protein